MADFHPSVQALISRRSLLRAGAFVGAGVAVSPVLAACASSGSTKSAATTSAATTLKWASSGLIQHLDPQAGEPSIVDYYAIEMIFDNITRRDANFNLVPGIATAWKQTDSTTWNFTIRTGVKFHNGDLLTASDVAYSINRVLDPATKSLEASAFATIKTATAVSPTTMVVMTNVLDPVLPDRLAWFPAYVVPENYTKSVGLTGFNAKPIGTGPYQFVSLSTTGNLKLGRNDDYWGTKYPVTDVLAFLRTDTASRVAALQTGEANLIDTPPVGQISSLISSGFSTVNVPSRSQFLLVPDTDIKPLDDVNLRRALSLSINRQSIITDLMFNTVPISHGPLVAGSVAYAQSEPNPLPYNIAQAKAALAQSTYNGEDLIIEYVPGLITAEDTSILEAIQSNWKSQLGINASLSALDYGTYNDKYITRKWKGIIVTGFSDITGDPQGSIWRVMMPGGLLDYWTDSEFDQLGAQAATSSDQALRLQNYVRMVEIMLDQMPMISVFEVTDTFVTKGVQPHITTTEFL